MHSILVGLIGVVLGAGGTIAYGIYKFRQYQKEGLVKLNIGVTQNESEK